MEGRRKARKQEEVERKLLLACLTVVESVKRSSIILAQVPSWLKKENSQSACFVGLVFLLYVNEESSIIAAGGKLQ